MNMMGIGGHAREVHDGGGVLQLEWCVVGVNNAVSSELNCLASS